MPGSDKRINYQVRPAKSVERKMLCDLVREIQLLDGNAELRYIGLGAKYFTDFLLLHNEFAITDMISIEAEKERQIRYEFNKPLKYIEMRYGSTNEVLPQITEFDKKKNLIWLDYDDLIEESMIIDLETICRKLESGSLFFISCNCSVKGEVASDKMMVLRERLGDYFDESIEKNMYTSKKIPYVIRQVVNKKIESVLEMRNRISKNVKYEYIQLIFLKYKDGAPMMTLGGMIVDEEMKKKVERSNIFSKFSFLSQNDELYEINIPRLTNKEIQLILKHLPITLDEYEDNKDVFCGIEYNEIEDFEKIYRYYPYYSEGIFAT